MKTIKISAIIMAGALILSTLAGCAPKKDEGMYKIGITQLIEHESLDAARKGFIDGLSALGFEDGKNIVLDYQNAQGAQANLQTIASQFVSDKKDLILAISTPAAQSMANATKDIPILVTAVTDPKESKLVKSNEKPENNVSGTSDMAPIDKQIEMIRDFMPNIKKVGLLYSSSEDNSIAQIAIAKKACDGLGISYVEATVTGINDINQVVSDLSNKVEAIYSPTDNTIASALPNVLKITNDAKIPMFTGWAPSPENAGIASLSIDYYELGKLTAQQAVDILTRKSVPADMPILHQENCKAYINEENAKVLGITIPEKYLG
ncbi:MAG: ABC transporter substrate-binding protein [Oscillospiraceae bacterium]